MDRSVSSAVFNTLSMPAERALDFLKEFIDPDTGDAKYADQLVRRPLSALA